MADRVIIGDVQFSTLVAVTSEEAERGLMFKSWPPPIMAFPFKKAGIRKFWMKNTISPLDIIFSRAGKIIAIYSGEPLSLDYIGPNEPCDLVVELPAGTVINSEISIGANIKLCCGIYTVAKKFRQYF